MLTEKCYKNDVFNFHSVFFTSMKELCYNWQLFELTSFCKMGIIAFSNLIIYIKQYCSILLSTKIYDNSYMIYYPARDDYFYRKMHYLFLVITYLQADFTATFQIPWNNMRQYLFDNGFGIWYDIFTLRHTRAKII